MTQLATTRDRVTSVRTMLERSKGQIATALPKHMNAERLLRVAMTSIQRTPRLLECDPVSLVGAVIQAAQLGLEPDGVLGHAYLIPYRNNRKGTYEVQFQPGYKGLLALARRSGDISGVEARVVYGRDRFKYTFGLVPTLEHVPSTEEDRGEPAYAYAIIRLKDGTAQWDVMSAAEIEAHRKRYSRASDDSPWVTAWDEMAKKTVLKRVLKLAPASVELQKAIALDEHAEVGLPQDLDAVAVAEQEQEPTGEKPPASKLDTLTEKLEEKKPASPASPPPPPSDDPDTEALNVERGHLIAAILPLLDTLSPVERTAALADHGFTEADSLDTADPAALTELKAALVKRQNESAGGKGRKA